MPDTKRPENVGPALVEFAEVTYVNIDGYTVDLMTQFGQRPLSDVPFAVPYCDESSGINFMPQIGDLCYAVLPGDNSGAFVLGFVRNGQTRDGAVPQLEDIIEGTGPDYSDKRPTLEPGDISLSTKDGNFVTLRRGGVVQIGATSLSQRLYIPLENLIRDYFQRYQAVSPLGEIEWGHASIENGIDADKQTAVLVKFSCREVAQDKEMSVEVRTGRLNEEVLDMSKDVEHVFAKAKTSDGLDMEPDVGLLSVTVNPQSEGVKYVFQVDRKGNNFLRSEAHIHVEAGEGVYLKAEGGVKVEVPGVASSATLELTDTEQFKLAVKSALLDLLGNITIKAGSVTIASGSIALGNGGSKILVDNGLLAWMANHTHLVPNGTPLAAGPVIAEKPIPGPPNSTSLNVTA